MLRVPTAANRRKKSQYFPLIGDRMEELRMPAGGRAAIVILSILALGFLIWAIIVTVQVVGIPSTTPGEPIVAASVYTPDTVPRVIDDLVKEYMDRVGYECGFQFDAAGINTLSSAWPGYKENPVKVTILYADDPDDCVSVVYKEYYHKVRDALTSSVRAQLSPGQLKTLEEMFFKPNRWDNWLNDKDGMPEVCQELDRFSQSIGHFSTRFAGEYSSDMHTDMIAQAFNSFESVTAAWGDGYVSNYAFTPPVFNDASLDAVISTINAYRGALEEMRENQFYERALDYAETKGFSYPTHRKYTQLTNLVDVLTILMDSSNFAGGSSLMYDATLFKGAEVGYTPSSGKDTELKDAIIAAEAELVVFIDYMLSVLDPDPRVYDSLSCPTILGGGNPNFPVVCWDPTTDWFASMNETLGISELCIKPFYDKSILGDGGQKDAYDRLIALAEEKMAIADPIFDADIPDYLGWNFLWGHYFYPGCFGVTDIAPVLNQYPIAECAGGVDSDWNDLNRREMQRYTIGKQTFGSTFGPLPTVVGYVNGDVDYCGTLRAYVTWHHTDHDQTTAVSLRTGNNFLDYKYAGFQWLTTHEYQHADQTAGFIGAHNNSWFSKSLWKAFTVNQPIHANSPSIEGSAASVDGQVLIEDGDFLVDTEVAGAFLDPFFNRLWDYHVWYAGFRSGEVSLSEMQDADAILNPYPWGDFLMDDYLGRSFSNYYLGASFNEYYAYGALRYYEFYDRLKAECPAPTPENGADVNPQKRSFDIQNALPFLTLNGYEAIIDEYIASGCSVFPYRQSVVFQTQ